MVVDKMNSFLSPTAAPGCRDLARTHEVANVFLKEAVVVVQLIMLLLDCLDTVENGE